MRVLHIINGEHYSGAERVQDLLALGLTENGIECAFAVLKRGRFGCVRKSTSELRDFSSGHGLLQAKRIAAYAKAGRFSAIHSHTPRSALVAFFVRALTGLPHFHHGHSPTDEDSSRFLMNRINVLAERNSIRGCTHLFAVSQRVVDYFTAIGVDRSRISLVENGVPEGKVRATIRAFCDKSSLRLGTVALFRPRKGLETALRALAHIVASGQPATFTGIGPFESESYRREIMNLIEELGISKFVDWTGFTENVPAAMSSLDMFVFPSLYGEGLPMALIEAMSVGLPCVGSDIDGVRDPLKGGAGLTVPAGDAERLAEACITLWRDEQLRGGISYTATLRQQERYSVSSMSRSVLQEYMRSIHAS